ncbi:MAG: lipoate--protein ligase family protein [Coriobacteriia bacterium]
MARDRAIQLAHARGLVPPTLRLYCWARPTVSIGRFQRASGIDRAACDAAGLDVVRRFTGGRGVLHDDEVTYSVVTGLTEGMPRGVAASYRVLCGMLVEAYAILGVSARLTARARGDSKSAACYLHATQADVSVGAAKLSGSAQVWYEGTVLQHGSIVKGRDVTREARIFGLDAHGARALGAEAATLRDLLGSEVPENSAICAALVAGLESALHVEVVPGTLTGFETESERELAPLAAVL